MDKERLKLIVRNLELLVDGLKAEVYSDPSAYIDKRENYDDPPHHYSDYDAVSYTHLTLPTIVRV